MNTLPSELVSLLGSSIFGSSMRLLSFMLMAHHREKILKLTKAHLRESSISMARNHPRSSLQLTRLFITILAVFSIIVLPKIIAILNPEIPISIGYSQICDGFLFFSSSSEKIRWTELRGLVITPLDTHLLSAIIGLYFGSALVDIKA